MERYVAENISKAIFLRDQIKKAGLADGCFPVSMQALGGDIHIQDILSSSTEQVKFKVAIQQKGLTWDWVIHTRGGVSPKDFSDLLEFRFPSHEAEGQFMGHFCGITELSGQNSRSHVFAILPREHMSRDVRRKLLKIMNTQL
jgi:hypothetical protein